MFKQMKQTHHGSRADGTKTANVELAVHRSGVICKQKNINIVLYYTILGTTTMHTQLKNRSDMGRGFIKRFGSKDTGGGGTIVFIEAALSPSATTLLCRDLIIVVNNIVFTITPNIVVKS
jgi:hypothetical protein